MECPTCINVELKETERLGFHFNYCPSCNGMWFERVELNKVLDRLVTEEIEDIPIKKSDIEPVHHTDTDSAITKQIYENREMHYHHDHPRSRHWMHHLFR